MTLGRVLAGLGILSLYLVGVAAVVFVSYKVSPPSSPDQWKEFGVRAGIAVTAVGVFVGILVSLFTLNTQLKAATDLENKKGEILKGVENHKIELQKNLEAYRSDILLSVEDRKKELLAEIERLKGGISRQNEFLSRTLDVKTQAYNELFKASSACYWELQNLAKGEFDKERVRLSEQSLVLARGLAANLDSEDDEIIRTIVQKVYDISDLAEAAKGEAIEKGIEYKNIWKTHAKEFGDAITALHKRSLFHNRTTEPDSLAVKS